MLFTWFIFTSFLTLYSKPWVPMQWPEPPDSVSRIVCRVLAHARNSEQSTYSRNLAISCHSPLSSRLHALHRTPAGPGFHNGRRWPPYPQADDDAGFQWRLYRPRGRHRVGPGFIPVSYLRTVCRSSRYLLSVPVIFKSSTHATTVNFWMAPKSSEASSIAAERRISDSTTARRAELFRATGMAYAMEQATRPSTIGLALSASPLALLSWWVRSSLAPNSVLASMHLLTLSGLVKNSLIGRTPGNQ